MEKNAKIVHDYINSLFMVADPNELFTDKDSVESFRGELYDMSFNKLNETGDYLLTSEEYKNAYLVITNRNTQKILDDMTEKGLIETFKDFSGTICYRKKV